MVTTKPSRKPASNSRRRQKIACRESETGDIGQEGTRKQWGWPIVCKRLRQNQRESREERLSCTWKGRFVTYGHGNKRDGSRGPSSLIPNPFSTRTPFLRVTVLLYFYFLLVFSEFIPSLCQTLVWGTKFALSAGFSFVFFFRPWRWMQNAPRNIYDLLACHRSFYCRKQHCSLPRLWDRHINLTYSLIALRYRRAAAYGREKWTGLSSPGLWQYWAMRALLICGMNFTVCYLVHAVFESLSVDTWNMFHAFSNIDERA